MASISQQDSTLATYLAERWEQSAKKLADLAATLPANKLEWAPVDGVRSCGSVLRHVAFWNRYVADCLNGIQTDDSLNELPPAEYATKAKVLGALRESSQDVVNALQVQGAEDRKTLDLVVSFIEHNAEHYGQLVVYARLMGIVPPASR